MNATLEQTLREINEEVGKRDDGVVKSVLRQTLVSDASSLSAKLTALKLARAEAESRIAAKLAEAERIRAETGFDSRFLTMTDEVALEMLRAKTWPEEGVSYKDPSGVALKATPTCVCEQVTEDAVGHLPAEYVRVIPELKQPDKNRIKAAIRNGEKFYGFRNVESVSLKVHWS